MSGMDARTAESEVQDLCASEISCAVADAWAADRMAARAADVFDAHPGLARALDHLEIVTRDSALRKVRP